MATEVKTKTKAKPKPQSPKTRHGVHKRRQSAEAKKHNKSKKISSRSRERLIRETREKKMKQEAKQEPVDLEEKELIWDPEVSYVGVPLDLPEEKKEVLGELEPERKLWKTDTPIHDRTKIPEEWKWNDEEPDLASE